jgi:hypothetical protein
MTFGAWLFAQFIAYIVPLFLALRSLVSYDPVLDDEGNEVGHRRWLRPAVWFAVGNCGFLIVHILCVKYQPDFKPVLAPAFTNFIGCKAPYRDPNDLRFLSSSCVDHHYNLDANYVYKIGLPVQGRGNRWLRVGNDAFLVTCGTACRVLDSRRAVFFQSHSQSE